MKRITLLFIRYLPVIQMVSFLLNNIFAYYDADNNLVDLLDAFLANSLASSFLLYITSYLFGFPIWHRMIIICNLICSCVAFIDYIWRIPISDVSLLFTYFTIVSLFLIFLGIYSKINYLKD